MLKLLGMGFAAERRLFGGGSEGGGGGGSDDKPAQRSQDDIQKDINKALKDSGGAWTSELNGLVAERDAAKAGGGATSAPAAVSAAPAGASGFTFGSTPVGSLPAAKTTTTTAAVAPATAYSFGSTPVGSLPAASVPARDDRAPSGTYSGTGVSLTDMARDDRAPTPVTTPAATSATTARDDRAPAATYTGTGTTAATNKVVSDVILGKTPASYDTFDEEYARLSFLGGIPDLAIKQYASTGTVLPGYESLIQTFEREKAPATAAPAVTTVVTDPRVNIPPAPLPPAPTPVIDYTVTASGAPYEDTALQDIYVSGAEAALGPDAGVRYQDLRDTARSYGEDMGVTAPSGPTPVVDLGLPLELAGLETGIGTLVQPSSGIVTDPVAEALATQRAQEAAAAEAARVRAELEALDALRRTTGVQPGLTSAAVDPFAATPLGPIGNVMDVGYGVGQVDPALAAEINRSQITEDQYRQAVANHQADLGLGAFTTSSAASALELLGELGKALTDRSVAPVGYGVGQVDPALAAAADQRMATELGYIPSNLPQSELYGTFADLAEAGDVLRSRAIGNAPRTGQEAFASPIWGIDEDGNISFNTDAFLTKAASSAVPTVASLVGALGGYAGLAATGAGMAAGETALEARQQAEAAAPAAGYTPEQAAVIAQRAANLAAGPGAVLGGVSNVMFGPFLPAGSPVRNIIGGATEEALTEGIGEQTISNIAAETAMGRPFSDLPYYGVAVSPDEVTLGLAGGALLGGIGSIPPGTTAAVSPVSVAPSGPAPFTPAAPGPAPFTPGAGPAATMTVEGTATDVTPGFRPTGPTVGQIAQTPPGLLSAYQQAAESLGAAGVRNIGGAPAPGMMDVAAATEIINNEISETGALSLRTAQNLENATGLGMESIRDIAESAPNVGVPRDNLITDVVTGTGGGGQIQVTANRDGSYTLRNLTTGDPQHVATVEAGQSLDEAIKVFDEVTTVGSPEAITVDTAGIASLPPTDPRLNIPPGSLPAAETTPAAEPTTALVPSGPATTTTQTGVTPRTTTEALTGVGTTGTSGVGSLTTVGAGTQLDVAQPVDLTATPAETAEIIEFTPTEDVIEGTAVEIAGQIPGTVATTTTPAVTTVETTTTPTTLPPTTTVVPDEEEEFVTVDVEEEGPSPGGGDEEGVEVELPPEMQETDEEEEAPFECPEGYTAVKMAGRWVCQKTETSMVGRPTIGTRPYLSRVGFAGPSPRPQQLTTRTRTVTAAE